MTESSGLALTFRALDLRDDRRAFECGHDSINRWFREQAGQAARKGTAATTIGVDDATGRIASFYALAAHRIEADGNCAPDIRSQRRYPLSAILLAQLAVDLRNQGTGVGRATLHHALQRLAVMSSEIGFEVVVVDALDSHAAEFYRRYRFVAISADERRFMLPTRALRAMFRALPSPPRD